MQRGKFTKEETSSPILALESVSLTSIADKKENRDSATLDLPNAFIQTTIGDEYVLMKLRGAVEELMVRVAPETHSDYITCENDTRILHV